MEFHSSASSSSVISDIEMESTPRSELKETFRSIDTIQHRKTDSNLSLQSNIEIGSSGSTPRSERKETFTSVDTIRHAASVIKCLRSSSSSLRYHLVNGS